MSRVLAFEAPPGQPVLRGIHHYWRVIRELDDRGPWSVADVHRQCGGNNSSSNIRDFVKRLAAGGYIEQTQTTQGASFRLLKSQLATPCLRPDGSSGTQGRGQTAMWNVLRGPIGRNGLTPAEIALYASTGSVPVALTTANSYVKFLLQAGYLLCVRKGKPHRAGIYRLKPDMHTGPLPPVILRGSIVFDQNRGEAIGPVEAREVEP